MKVIQLLLLPLFLNSVISAMQSPPPAVEIKSEQITPYLEQLKIAVSQNAASEEIRKLIEGIQKIRSDFARYPLERKRAFNIIAREKAFLLGHAKSFADIYNTQVIELTKLNRPITADLKKNHANAYINIELINDFLATLEPQ